MSSSEIVSAEQGLVTLRITVDSQSAVDAFRRALREVTLHANIPGFRKGKAPRAMVERFAGADYITEQAVRSFAPDAYEQAIKDAGLTPIDDPEFEGFDGVNLESGDDVVFTAKVWVRPTVELMDYSDIKIDREGHEAAAEEVDAAIESFREDLAEYVPVDRTVVESGDLVNLDIAGSLEGERLDKLSAGDTEVTVGSGQLIPGLDEKIAGLKLDEAASVQVSLPAEHPDGELAGREVTFVVTVKSIKAKQLPELNDEFAASLEGVKDMADLRERVEHNLVHRALSRAVRNVAIEALNRISKGSNVGESKLLIDRRLDQMVSEIRSKAQEQGVEWGRYLEMRGKTEEELRADLHDTAAQRVHSDLIVEEIATRESLMPTERQVSMTLLQMIGDPSRMPEPAVEKLLRDPQLRSAAFEVAIRTAVLDWLGTHCDSDPESATCGHVHTHDHDHDHEGEHDHGHEAEAAEQE